MTNGLAIIEANDPTASDCSAAPDIRRFNENRTASFNGAGVCNASFRSVGRRPSCADGRDFHLRARFDRTERFHVVERLGENIARAGQPYFAAFADGGTPKAE